MALHERLTLLVTPSPQNQALDGESLDLKLLDERVEAWKSDLGLFDQPEFPPKNVTMTEGSIRFHDRSHILVQDYFGKSSYDLRVAYGESSLPPVFEELLTYFFSKVMHQFDSDPFEKTTSEVLRIDILLMRHLGYIDDNSIFIRDIQNISKEISSFYQSITERDDFNLFKLTLMASTRDCENWEALEVHG